MTGFTKQDWDGFAEGERSLSERKERSTQQTAASQAAVSRFLGAHFAASLGSSFKNSNDPFVRAQIKAVQSLNGKLDGAIGQKTPLDPNALSTLEQVLLEKAERQHQQQLEPGAKQHPLSEPLTALYFKTKVLEQVLKSAAPSQTNTFNPIMPGA